MRLQSKGRVLRLICFNVERREAFLKLGFQFLIRLGPFLDSRPVSEHGVTFCCGNDPLYAKKTVPMNIPCFQVI